MGTTSSINHYQTLTDRIIEMLQSPSITSWDKPWFPVGIPTNIISGKPYRGINALYLAVSHAGSRWGTYKQWESVGAQVRRGERSTIGVYWSVFEKPSASPDAPAKRIPFLKTFPLFNESQVDNAPPAPTIPTLAASERCPQLDQLFAGHAPIKADPAKAFYAPTEDAVYMPPFEQFKSGAQYYGTLAHEFGHWTGHQTRLNRNLTGRFGTESYAMEELVAELTTVFVCAASGVAVGIREDHVSYIKNWLAVLKQDNKAIVKAASLAQAAADYLLGVGPTEKSEENGEGE